MKILPSKKVQKKQKKVLTLKINRGIILNVPSNERKKDRNKLVKQGQKEQKKGINTSLLFCTFLEKNREEKKNKKL